MCVREVDDYNICVLMFGREFADYKIDMFGREVVDYKIDVMFGREVDDKIGVLMFGTG